MSNDSTTPDPADNVAIDHEAKETIESFGDAAGVATMPADERDELLGRDAPDADAAERGEPGADESVGTDDGAETGTEEAG